MTEVKKSRFEKFRNADVMGVRRYIEEGEHVFLIKRADQSASKNPEKVKKNAGLEKTVVDLKVIKTRLLEGSHMIETEDGKPAKRAQGRIAEFDPLRVNESCSLVETSDSTGYLGNVLSFTAGVLGMSIDEMNADEQFDEIFEGAYGSQQIFAGMLVRCIAQQVPTTSPTAKSKVYTAKTWEAVPASEYAEYGLVAPDGAFDPDATEETETEAAAEPSAA